MTQASPKYSLIYLKIQSSATNQSCSKKYERHVESMEKIIKWMIAIYNTR